MKKQKVDLEGARAWAKQAVEDFQRDLSQDEATFPGEQYEYALHVTRLSNLHAKEPSLDWHQQEDLVSYGFSCAARQGYALPGYA